MGKKSSWREDFKVIYVLCSMCLLVYILFGGLTVFWSIGSSPPNWTTVIEDSRIVGITCKDATFEDTEVQYKNVILMVNNMTYFAKKFENNTLFFYPVLEEFEELEIKFTMPADWHSCKTETLSTSLVEGFDCKTICRSGNKEFTCIEEPFACGENLSEQKCVWDRWKDKVVQSCIGEMRTECKSYRDARTKEPCEIKDVCLEIYTDDIDSTHVIEPYDILSRGETFYGHKHLGVTNFSFEIMECYKKIKTNPRCMEHCEIEKEQSECSYYDDGNYLVNKGDNFMVVIARYTLTYGGAWCKESEDKLVCGEDTYNLEEISLHSICEDIELSEGSFCAKISDDDGLHDLEEIEIEWQKK